MACRAFKLENRGIAELKQEFPGRVHLYWTAKEPKQHFVVIDGFTVILLQPKYSMGGSFWGNITQSYQRAEEWSRRFDEYVQYCREIEF